MYLKEKASGRGHSDALIQRLLLYEGPGMASATIRVSSGIRGKANGGVKSLDEWYQDNMCLTFSIAFSAFSRLM